MVESKRDYDDRIASKEDIAAVSCSICLDFVVDGERSRAKLKCGHKFHLDCIGSAFNMKGSMQCPNCRTIEKGHWLYANDVAQAAPDDSVHEWTPEQEEPYELTFPELTSSVQWCPFQGLARYRFVPEDMETPSAIYQWLPEQTAASTYINQRPLPSAADGVEDPIFNHRWNVTANDDITVLQSFPGMDFQYQSWIHRPSSTSSYIDAAAAEQVTNPNLMMRAMNDESSGQGSSDRPSTAFLPSGETLLSTGRRRTHDMIRHGRPPIFQQSVIPPTQRIRRRYFHGRPAAIAPPSPISHHDGNGTYYVMNPSPVLMQNPNEVLILRPVPSHQWQPWDLFRSSSPDNADLNWPSVYEATGIYGGGVWQRYWSS